MSGRAQHSTKGKMLRYVVRLDELAVSMLELGLKCLNHERHIAKKHRHRN